MHRIFFSQSNPLLNNILAVSTSWPLWLILQWHRGAYIFPKYLFHFGGADTEKRDCWVGEFCRRHHTVFHTGYTKLESCMQKNGTELFWLWVVATQWNTHPIYHRIGHLIPMYKNELNMFFIIFELFHCVSFEQGVTFVSS